MTAPRAAPRHLYLDWVETQIEDYKATLTRDELLDIAEEAVARIRNDPDGQLALTELLLCDAVDGILFERMGLPDFRTWRRTCQKDTESRPTQRTDSPFRAAS